MTLSVHVKKALKLANPEATKARLSEGRQWIGIKNIEAPDELQPRAGIDKDWVSQLEGFRREGSEFPAARLYQLPDGRLMLAEGHHRRWALLGAGESEMFCEVVNGSMEDAISYAACSNRTNGVKPMGRKDIERAINMVLALESWWNKSDLTIAKKVGCSASSVVSVRSRFALANNKDMPSSVTTELGHVRRTERRLGASREIFISLDQHGKQVRTAYRGRTYYAPTEEELKRRLQLVFNSEDKRKKVITAVGAFLGRNGFKGFKWAPNGFSGFGGYYGHGIAAVACKLEDNTELLDAVGNLKALRVAVGKIEACRQKDRTLTRSVIVCYRQDGPKAAIELFEQAGIEFMTPDELIASLGPVIPEELKNDGQ